MKKTLLKAVVLGAFLFSSSVSFAGEGLTKESEQSVVIKKNSTKGLERPRTVIKMNLSSLVFRNMAFQTEFAFHKNMSAAAGFSFLLPYRIPSSFLAEQGEGGFSEGSFGGFTVTPEFRLYPGKKEEHQAPHGFYLAPYGRYAKFTAKASYLDPVEDINGSAEASYSGFGGGLMIGSQWIIGNHFSIDFFILGGHIGSGKVAVKVYDSGFSGLSQEDKDAIEQSFMTDVATYGSGADVSFEGDYIKASVKAPFGGVRGLGLNIGFVF